MSPPIGPGACGFAVTAAMLVDADGKEYIDGLAGLWNVVLGHGRRELADAAREQLETLAYASGYSGSSNVRAIELAERLTRLTYPNINRFFFTSGGAEANESAIKMARSYWKLRGRPDKTKVISRELGYHGTTLAAMSATGIAGYWPLFEPRVPGFIHIPSPYPYRAATTGGTSYGVTVANALEEAIVREGADTVAMFLAEPVIGVGGVIVPPDDYFPRIREICDRHEVLFAADEVITGFGRTGKWFALEHWGVAPDIVQFAKAITSGYVPFGGIGVSDAIARVIDEAPVPWMHAYTYSASSRRVRRGAAHAADHRGRESCRRSGTQGGVSTGGPSRTPCAIIRTLARFAARGSCARWSSSRIATRRRRSRPKRRSARAFTPRRSHAVCSVASAATCSCSRRRS